MNPKMIEQFKKIFQFFNLKTVMYIEYIVLILQITIIYNI